MQYENNISSFFLRKVAIVSDNFKVMGSSVQTLSAATKKTHLRRLRLFYLSLFYLGLFYFHTVNPTRVALSVNNAVGKFVFFVRRFPSEQPPVPNSVITFGMPAMWLPVIERHSAGTDAEAGAEL